MTTAGRFLPAFGSVTGALDALGVGWCLTGSMASVHYGVPRATMDVDLVAEMRPAHVRPFREALGAAFYASPEAVGGAVRRRGSFNVIHIDTAMKVDVFVLGDSSYERESFSRRRREVVAPFGPCFVPSPEDVLLSKILWYEKGGRVSDRQWGDVLGILRSRGPGMDGEYLERWAADRGVGDLLEAARKAAVRAEPPPRDEP